ncbi:MAG: glycosyltransferase, partial [Thermoanaerobaculia bacterium]|nr:glycosyltransferase [Thermoanaerobaculia bacterium]
HRRPYEVYGAQVQPLGYAQRAGWTRLPLYWRAIRRLEAQARERPFDVLHALWAHEPGFVATAAGRRIGTPVLVSLLGGELTRLPDIGYGGQLSVANRLLIARALRRATSVIVGSEMVKRLAAKSVAAERLLRLPLGVDLRRFSPDRPGGEAERRLDGDPAILHVASLSPVKDQPLLLEAFASVSLTFPNARLHVVGDGPLRGELEARCRGLDLAAAVTYHGAVDHGDLPAYYRAADFCALASRFESQCMVVLEAAACARITVGTAVGVLPELAGTCVEPENQGALAAALADAVRDRERTKREGRRWQRRVAERYGLEASVARLEDLYAQVSRPARAGRASSAAPPA